jgi:hypothetical protein
MSEPEGKDGVLAQRATADDPIDEYLREINGLSKIFITLSFAILGLLLSFIAPRLGELPSVHWVVATWFALLAAAAVGFIQIYAFARRFRSRAEYLHACLISDVIVQTGGSDAKLEDFCWRSDQADRRFKHGAVWCQVLVLAQALFLFSAIGFLTVFAWNCFVTTGTP